LSLWSGASTRGKELTAEGSGAAAGCGAVVDGIDAAGNALVGNDADGGLCEGAVAARVFEPGGNESKPCSACTTFF